jgi:hypothetical protein
LKKDSLAWRTWEDQGWQSCKIFRHDMDYVIL